MKATVRDTFTLQSIRPYEMIAYLRSRGWTQAQQMGELGAFWVLDRSLSRPTESNTGTGYESPASTSDDQPEVMVPLDSTTPGFAQRVAELLRDLEEHEQRSQLEILEDLSFASADVIRPRLPGIPENGMLSLEDGKIAYERARDLMLAAACAAMGPKEVFAKRKPEQAMNYLSHALFGVPKRGSYIMTIISPVTPRLVEQGSDLTGHELQEPFERRTVRILSQALGRLASACNESMAKGDIEPMRRSVPQGVSANLCDAIIALHQCGGGRGLDFSFSWAPSRGQPVDPINRVSIISDYIPVLEETSRVFRETSPLDGVEVVGTVQKLEHQRQDHGRVTIQGFADGVSRAVIVELAGDEHRMAVSSYEQRVNIRCYGDLVKERQSWVLRNPREVMLLSQENLASGESQPE
jgi:hypothetical protein